MKPKMKSSLAKRSLAVAMAFMMIPLASVSGNPMLMSLTIF